MSAIPATEDEKRGSGAAARGRGPAPGGSRPAGPVGPVGPVGPPRGAWTVLVLAVVVGAGAGVGSIVFRWCIRTFTLLLSGHSDYAASPGAANPHVPWLGPYFVLLAPVVGGLLHGPLVNRFAKEARGHGVPEVMLAVAQRGGRISPKVAVVKTLASALTIGSGGSVGREGPIVQIGSALGSTLGRLTGAAEGRMRLLVACGAAGGIAATFNAPLAGVFFAMELILGAFSAEAFGATVLASVTASVIGRAAFGDNAFLNLPGFHVGHLSQYGLFALLGVVAAVVGVGFARFLYVIEDVCDRLWRARSGCARRSAGRRSAWSSWPCPRCTASATRSCNGRPRAATRPASCFCCWPGRCWRPVSPSASAAPAASSRPACSSGRCSARRTASGSTTCCPARPAPWGRTRSSAWARCSPARPGRRSPPWSSSSS
ncbi:fumarate reductase subunit D [Streptomyces phaeogriseichromatogenes]|nr:fumarate reductase subunit D [Streptomyces murinus]